MSNLDLGSEENDDKGIYFFISTFPSAFEHPSVPDNHSDQNAPWASPLNTTPPPLPMDCDTPVTPTASTPPYVPSRTHSPRLSSIERDDGDGFPMHLDTLPDSPMDEDPNDTETLIDEISTRNSTPFTITPTKPRSSFLVPKPLFRSSSQRTSQNVSFSGDQFMKPKDVVGKMNILAYASLSKKDIQGHDAFLKAFKNLNGHFKHARNEYEFDSPDQVRSKIMDHIKVFIHDHALGPIPATSSFSSLDAKVLRPFFSYQSLGL